MSGTSEGGKKAMETRAENAGKSVEQIAAEMGHKGGQQSKGNFKNDPKRAAKAGQKGGQHSTGNFKNDPKRAAEVGRKGGQKSRRSK